jgi:uncharacterized membrane protein YfcA
MGGPALIILTVVAFATAMLSGILGMGGGMLLLAVMFCFLPHGEAIPTHAAVQLVSNSTRSLAFIRHVDWRTLGRFVVGAIPGGAVGLWLRWSLGPPDEAEPYLKTLVGVYILVAAVLPKPKSRDGQAGRWWDFPLLGLVAGAAALTVGAVGPLIAPLFARRRFVKENLSATKALCQMFLHLVKIPAFLAFGGIDVQRLGWLALVMSVAVIPGTLLGKRMLRYVSEDNFIRLYKIALIVAGAKVLLIDGVRAIWLGGS